MSGRDLIEQTANVHSAGIALVEVLGRAPWIGKRCRVEVDGVQPLLTLRLLQHSHNQALGVVKALGLDLTHKSFHTSRDVHFAWSGFVADFPIKVVRVEVGSRRQPRTTSTSDSDQKGSTR